MESNAQATGTEQKQGDKKMNAETAQNRMRTIPAALDGLGADLDQLKRDLYHAIMSGDEQSAALLTRQKDANEQYQKTIRDQLDAIRLRYCTTCGTELVDVGRTRRDRSCPLCA